MAIVLAMGVAALAALAATAILVTQSTWARQVELAAGHVQARLLLHAGLDWARAILGDDRRAGGVDHLGEPWALQLPPVPVENGSLAGRIDDLQGRFNLNNLQRGGKVDAAQLARFQRLLGVLSLPQGLAGVVAARIASTGAPMLDAADLAAVPGFDGASLARLRPFVSALPRATAVNANTASPEVLAATIEGLGLDGARAIVAQRTRAHFRSLDDFLRRLPEGSIAPAGALSVGSEYFLATMRATIGGAQADGAALLVREAGGAWPVVAWSRTP